MPRNPFGWDLPPGCSQRDIDRATGEDEVECPECEGEGTHDYGEGDQPCKRCEGDGFIDADEIRKERQEAEAERRADEIREEGI